MNRYNRVPWEYILPSHHLKNLQCIFNALAFPYISINEFETTPGSYPFSWQTHELFCHYSNLPASKWTPTPGVYKFQSGHWSACDDGGVASRGAKPASGGVFCRDVDNGSELGINFPSSSSNNTSLPLILELDSEPLNLKWIIVLHYILCEQPLDHRFFFKVSSNLSFLPPALSSSATRVFLFFFLFPFSFFFLKKNSLIAQYVCAVHKMITSYFHACKLLSWCMWHPSQSDLLHVHVKDAAMPSKKMSGAMRRSPRDGAAYRDQNLDVCPCVESLLQWIFCSSSWRFHLEWCVLEYISFKAAISFVHASLERIFNSAIVLSSKVVVVDLPPLPSGLYSPFLDDRGEPFQWAALSRFLWVKSSSKSLFRRLIFL